MFKLNQLIGIFSVLLMTQISQAALLINGAGSSFTYPLYSKWFSEYSKVDTSVKINYQSIGSGGGITQFLAQTTDFGASDSPMTDAELKKAHQKVLHIPMVLGAVTLSYNVPSLAQHTAKEPLKLDGPLVADIFMGVVTKWNDPRIVEINPHLKAHLPDLHIVPCARSDGSGTTGVFTDYLAKVSVNWQKTIGAGKTVSWPAGLQNKGNEGVTGLIRQNPGALGYIEVTYAATNNLPVAAIKNREGDFVMPTLEAISIAGAGGLKDMPADFRVSITDAPGKGVYPISAFTYLLVYQNLNATKGPHIVKFLNWALGPGQSYTKPLKYAPLPESLVVKIKKTIDQIVVK